MRIIRNCKGTEISGIVVGFLRIALDGVKATRSFLSPVKSLISWRF
jgi:hypothetical protein